MLRLPTQNALVLLLLTCVVAWGVHHATAGDGSVDTLFDDAPTGQKCEAEAACVDEPCESGNGRAAVVAANLDNIATAIDAFEERSAHAPAAAVAATHKQTGIIKANVPGHAEVTAECFCIAKDDSLLIGCHVTDSKSDNKDELRVFDSSGELVRTIPLPVTPDAINVDPSGNVLVAGGGELLRITMGGKELLRAKAPHVTGMGEGREALRKQIVAQHEQQSQMYTQQAKRYEDLVKQTEEQLKGVTDQMTALKQHEEGEESVIVADDDDSNDNVADENDHDVAVGRKIAVLAARETLMKRRVQQYKQMQEQWDQVIAQMGETKPLTEEQIEQHVDAAIRSKMAVSSVSSAGGKVFVACRSTVGYGYEVWKMDEQFAGGEVIIKGLSGCCGQMDVQACDGGLFVAENSKHRASRYSFDGEAEKHWGKGDRTSLEGFGSCCNPMNVAFGPGGAVYTAEDDTGRIKRYSPDGELLGLVGKVDLVPGCKNVAIGVSSDGDHVYMIDVNRHHVVRMDRVTEDAAQPVAQASYEKAETPAHGSSSPIVSVLKLLSGQ